MKVNKALKLKNKLIKQANSEFSKVAQNNIYRSGTFPSYNSKDCLAKYLEKIDELIDLKTQIHKANYDVYRKIFRMAELKNIISKLRSIPTSEPHTYNTIPNQEYIIEIDKLYIDNMIQKYEDEIEAIQEELEQHNHTKDIG